MFKINGTTITLTRGDTAQIQVAIKDQSGQSYTPQSGDKIRFAMKRRYTDTKPLIHKDINTATMLVTIVPGDTKSLAFGEYVYDIELTMSDGTVDTFIDRAKFILTEEVE